jgi:hypothetical protein
MSDTPNNPEQEQAQKQSADAVSDLSEKQITEEDAEAVKGGSLKQMKYDSLKVK